MQVKKLLQIMGLVTGSLSLFIPVMAQEIELNPMDTLANRVNLIQEQTDMLKKLKISGYIQAQYQKADSAGIASFSGGNFASNVDQRFTIRRGRIKFTYDNLLTRYVLQLDATERGVGIKDAYIRATEPYLQALSLTAGIFDRPFGYEISYSSSQRESPERSRVFQTLFPGDRELGAMLTLQAPRSSRWNFIKLDGGLFNGSGPVAIDYDSKKDFISHLGLKKTFLNEKIQVSGGASWYKGYVTVLDTANVYITDGPNGYKKDGARAANKNRALDREYKGIDAQVSFDFPFGTTTLLAEFLSGTQAGTKSTSTSLSAYPAATSVTTYTIDTVNLTAKATTVTTPADFYIRNFEGFYVYWIQNILQTRHQLVVKYDLYDPNTAIKGTEIKNAGNMTATDVAYSTLGLGYIFRMSSNIRFTAYYDMVTNENTALGYKYDAKDTNNYMKDIKDNVLTLRLMYRF